MHLYIYIYIYIQISGYIVKLYQLYQLLHQEFLKEIAKPFQY